MSSTNEGSQGPPVLPLPLPERRRRHHLLLLLRSLSRSQCKWLADYIDIDVDIDIDFDIDVDIDIDIDIDIDKTNIKPKYIWEKYTREKYSLEKYTFLHLRCKLIQLQRRYLVQWKKIFNLPILPKKERELLLLHQFLLSPVNLFFTQEEG